MKLALINGSPKAGESASEALIKGFVKFVRNKIECVEVKLNKQDITDEKLEILSDCDAWLFFFPIYVDGVPGHLVSCLKKLESLKDRIGNKFVCAVTNCGFSDGEQGELSMNIVKHWSRKAGHTWGGGIGIGEGGALPELLNHKLYQYPKILIGGKFKKLAEYIKERHQFDNIYINGGLPMIFYKLAVERYWGKRLRENGKKRKDISYAP